MITNPGSDEISSTKHEMLRADDSQPELLHATDSKPELLHAEEPQSLHMIIDDSLVDPMKALYDCFFVKLDLEHLDLQNQPVDVKAIPRSTDCPIPFSPILPEIFVDIPVLNLAVSPDLGPPASNPVTPVTYAQMLVSKIRTTAADNPLGPKIMYNDPPVNCLVPGTNFLDPGSVKLYNASDHVHPSWSTMLATRRRRPLFSTRTPRPPETIPPLPLCRHL